MNRLLTLAGLLLLAGCAGLPETASPPVWAYYVWAGVVVGGMILGQSIDAAKAATNRVLALCQEISAQNERLAKDIAELRWKIDSLEAKRPGGPPSSI